MTALLLVAALASPVPVTRVGLRGGVAVPVDLGGGEAVARIFRFQADGRVVVGTDWLLHLGAGFDVPAFSSERVAYGGAVGAAGLGRFLRGPVYGVAGAEVRWVGVAPYALLGWVPYDARTCLRLELQISQHTVAIEGTYPTEFTVFSGVGW